jgi:hypothetical protein
MKGGKVYGFDYSEVYIPKGPPQAYAFPKRVEIEPEQYTSSFEDVSLKVPKGANPFAAVQYYAGTNYIRQSLPGGEMYVAYPTPEKFMKAEQNIFLEDVNVNPEKEGVRLQNTFMPLLPKKEATTFNLLPNKEGIENGLNNTYNLRRIKNPHKSSFENRLNSDFITNPLSIDGKLRSSKTTKYIPLTTSKDLISQNADIAPTSRRVKTTKYIPLNNTSNFIEKNQNSNYEYRKPIKYISYSREGIVDNGIQIPSSVAFNQKVPRLGHTLNSTSSNVNFTGYDIPLEATSSVKNNRHVSVNVDVPSDISIENPTVVNDISDMLRKKGVYAF